ncbi:hypothetical protein, partial [Klebsiella pneumoniae]|uniref:hypothetical protein n=2 Tax=Pseudomonadota TaxID=1224 RepID=UPI001BCB212C
MKNANTHHPLVSARWMLRLSMASVVLLLVWAALSHIDQVNLSVNSETLSFKLDTASAAKPSLSLLNDAGSSATDKTTNDGTVKVDGLEVGATWQYSLNNGLTWLDGSGNTVKLTGDGSKVVQVQQFDVAGNRSAISDSLSFTLDSVAPVAPAAALAVVTSTTNSRLTNNGTINVTGVEGGATWQYSVDGTNWLDGSGSSFRFKGAVDGGGNTDGAKKIQVRQTDLAGNTGPASVAFNFTLDTTPPAKIGATLATSKTLVDGNKLTNDGTINIAALEALATWQYSTDNGTSWTTASGSNVKIKGAVDGSGATDGDKKVLVRQVDAAGNPGPNSDALNFKLDTMVPATLTLGLATNSGDIRSDAVSMPAISSR